MGFYERIYPEAALFGFPAHHHHFNFFALLDRIVSADQTVLDFGAGRGEHVDGQPAALRDLRILKGRVREVVGADVSDAVRDNPYIDRAVVFDPSAPLPFADASFDMVVAFSVFEHLEEPRRAAAEIDRVLKPGGYLCGYTPNRWGYVALGARLTPDALRGPMQRAFAGMGEAGGREEEDFFPTHYRLNSMAALRRAFPEHAYEHFSHYYNGPPAYTGGRAWLGRLFITYEWLAPRALSRNIHIFLRKKPGPRAEQSA
ncbi:MAG: class I SAM-dependent methyltransferase [Pseudomonadota bacterium]